MIGLLSQRLATIFTVMPCDGTELRKTFGRTTFEKHLKNVLIFFARETRPSLANSGPCAYAHLRTTENSSLCYHSLGLINLEKCYDSI